MKYFAIIIVLFLVFFGLFAYFYDGKPPQAFVDLVEKQQNPFSVPKDSSEIVWQKAKDFMKIRENMIVGGNLQIKDSIIYLPYNNDYHKGNSLRFERTTIGDSVQFQVTWWYSGKPSETGAKEIVLYMQHDIERYSFISKQKRPKITSQQE